MNVSAFFCCALTCLRLPLETYSTVQINILPAILSVHAEVAKLELVDAQCGLWYGEHVGRIPSPFPRRLYLTIWRTAPDADTPLYWEVSSEANKCRLEDECFMIKWPVIDPKYKSWMRGVVDSIAKGIAQVGRERLVILILSGLLAFFTWLAYFGRRNAIGEPGLRTGTSVVPALYGRLVDELALVESSASSDDRLRQMRDLLPALLARSGRRSAAI